MVELLARSGDPDQMLYSVMSELSLHCLPVTLLRVSRLQWVKEKYQMEDIYCSINRDHSYRKEFAPSGRKLFP